MSTAWMPPGMSQEDKDAYAAAWPNDPHMAAAMAWEDWAATLEAEPSVQSVSTGAQSITYKHGGGSFGAAMERANWHRSRARVYSVPVGPEYAFGWDLSGEQDEATYESAPIPQIGSAQINLPTGTVGPAD